MSYGYIPDSDGDFRAWAETFAQSLIEQPSAFMLAPAQAEGIKQAVDEYVAAYNVASHPATRTRVTIAAKQNARSIAETMCREWSQLIKHNLGVSDESKIAAGVPPINPSRTDRNCPQTSPYLEYIGGSILLHVLQFKDPTTPESKAKPFGATELQVFIAIGEKRNAPQSEARFYKKFTRNPLRITFDQADEGRIATYYVRWASARGETGPFSLPVSMRIAG